MTASKVCCDAPFPLTCALYQPLNPSCCRIYFLTATKKYKLGTNSITEWLTRTAEKCGHPLDFLEKQTASTSPKKGSGRSNYLVPIHHFAPLALYIVEAIQRPPADNQLEVPHWIVKVGREVIRLRGECSVFFREQARSDAAFKDSNQAHVHFIGVLQEVVDILSPHVKPLFQPPDGAAQTSRKETLRDKLTSEDDELTNIFEHLELDETTMEFDETELTVHTKPTAAKSSKQSIRAGELVTYIAETGSNDFMFLIFCLMLDLHNLRMFLQETWKQHKDGTLNVATAAITTDICIAAVREKEKDFVANVEVPLKERDRFLGEILYAHLAEMHFGKASTKPDLSEMVSRTASTQFILFLCCPRLGCLITFPHFSTLIKCATCYSEYVVLTFCVQAQACEFTLVNAGSMIELMDMSAEGENDPLVSKSPQEESFQHLFILQ